MDGVGLLWHGTPPGRAKALCVFVHGRGQTPEEMVPAVLARVGVPGIACALPRAPGKSWYKARAVDPMTEATRGELARSLDQLGQAIAGARAAAPGLPMLLAGFSQGACLSLEYAMRAGPWDGALACLTGARVGRPEDARPSADLAGMEAYLTGGDADPWIPVWAFADAAGALGEAHARLRADLFPGRPHEVCDAEIGVLEERLAALAARAGHGGMA